MARVRCDRSVRGPDRLVWVAAVVRTVSRSLPRRFRELGCACALENREFCTGRSLTEDVVPRVALRIESKRGTGVTVYSSESAPRDAVVALVRTLMSWSKARRESRPPG